MQALFLRQAALTFNPGIVQAMQAFIPRQAALIPSHIHWEGVQAVQALLPRQTRVFSPSQGASGTTAGDATSSPDNTTGTTGEQGAETWRAGTLVPPAVTSPIHAF